MTGNELFFAKVKENAIIPTKSSENAGYDLYACFDEDVIYIAPLETKMIPTGIATAMSNDWYMQIQERGSTGSKGIKYGAGVIDSGYRGEWFVPITNCTCKLLAITDKTFDEIRELDGQYVVHNKVCYNKNGILFYPKSKAIAQAVVLPVPKMDVKEISYDELLKIKSSRGTGALGSSGK
jgi:dUTP pyrophosphatase